jgi:hypothetical protein
VLLCIVDEFFLRELKNLFSVPSVSLLSNALVLYPSTNLSESTCELSHGKSTHDYTMIFPVHDRAARLVHHSQFLPELPSPAQPPHPVPPAKPHLLYHGRAATLTGIAHRLRSGHRFVREPFQSSCVRDRCRLIRFFSSERIFHGTLRVSQSYGQLLLRYRDQKPG